MQAHYSAEDVSLPFCSNQSLHKQKKSRRRRERHATLHNKTPIDQSRLNKVEWAKIIRQVEMTSELRSRESKVCLWWRIFSNNLITCHHVFFRFKEGGHVFKMSKYVLILDSRPLPFIQPDWWLRVSDCKALWSTLLFVILGSTNENVLACFWSIHRWRGWMVLLFFVVVSHLAFLCHRSLSAFDFVSLWLFCVLMYVSL